MLSDAWELFDPSIAPRDGDLGAYLQKVLERCSGWFQASGASIFLSDRTGQFRLAAELSVSHAIPKDASIQPGIGVAGASLVSGRPLLIGDPNQSPELEGTEFAPRPDLASAMVIPLIVPNGERIGVLNLSRSVGKDAFDERALNQASAIGYQIALAVSNARLLTEVKEAGRLRRLAEIGQMTAAVAHEIRNPLTSIRTAAQMLGTIPEQSETLAGIIEEEVLKLNRLCEEFLEYSKPVSLRLENRRLSEIAAQVAQLEQGEFDRCGVELEIELSSNDKPISVDPMRVEQILRNLLRNARDASERGTRTLLRATEHQIEVVDQGAGIPMDQQERLFTPFFTTKAKGTGLGLSNVRRIVEAHEGDIRVESTGVGSKFVVSFWSAA